MKELMSFSGPRTYSVMILLNTWLIITILVTSGVVIRLPSARLVSCSALLFLFHIFCGCISYLLYFDTFKVYISRSLCLIYFNFILNLPSILFQLISFSFCFTSSSSFSLSIFLFFYLFFFSCFKVALQTNNSLLYLGNFFLLWRDREETRMRRIDREGTGGKG